MERSKYAILTNLKDPKLFMQLDSNMHGVSTIVNVFTSRDLTDGDEELKTLLLSNSVLTINGDFKIHLSQIINEEMLDNMICNGWHFAYSKGEEMKYNEFNRVSYNLYP